MYLNDYKEYKDRYYLQEESRTLKLPVVEKETGCWCYGPSLESFEEIGMLYYHPFRGVIIDSIFEDDLYQLKTVKLYQQVLNHQLSAAEALEQLQQLNKDITYTALNQIKKTFLEKE